MSEQSDEDFAASKVSNPQTEIKPASATNKKKYPRLIYDYSGEGKVSHIFRCCKCAKEVIKKGGTSNLKQHLKTWHREIYKELVKREEELTPAGSSSKISAYFSATPQGATAIDADGTPLSQQSEQSGAAFRLEDITPRTGLAVPAGEFGHHLYYKDNDPDALFIRRNLSKMVCMDIQPFSLADDPGFLQFCNSMNPRYLVPSRQTIQRDVELLYDAQRKDVSDILTKSMLYFSSTHDAWTSCSQDGFRSFTLHFVSSDWTMESCSLHVIPFPGVTPVKLRLHW